MCKHKEEKIMKLKQKTAMLLAGTMVMGTVGMMPMQAMAAGTSNTFTLTVPASVSITGSGFNEIGNINVKGTIDETKNVKVSIDGVKDGKTVGVMTKKGITSEVTEKQKIGYEVKLSDGSAITEAGIDFSKADIAESGKDVAIGVKVNAAQFTAAEAGTYEGTINYTASIVSTVSAVAVSEIAKPITGVDLDTEATCSAPGVNVSAVTWTEKGQTDSVTRAAAGKEYTATVVLTAGEGYEFKDDASVTINGNTGTVADDKTAVSMTVSYDFRATAELPNITTQPANATAEGGSASFTVAADEVSDEGNLSYQWQVSTDGETWENIVSGTYATLSLSGLSNTDNDKKYHCVVTNTVGGEDPANASSTTSNSATLTVNE